jgi:hypothetical protein
MQTWDAITSRRNVRAFDGRADRPWAFLISLGYPADRPLTPVRNPRRRPLGEIVHRGRW